jgi:hypothetical protein
MAERGEISDVIASTARAVNLKAVMNYVREISEHDRYQASCGLATAAEIVAERASRAGLSDVRIETYPADGGTHWWSYQAPVSWTPVVARLEIHAADGQRVFVLDHAREPFAVATYSAGTPPGGTVRRLTKLSGTASHHLSGAIVLIGGPQAATVERQRELAGAGASGFITDAASREGMGQRMYRGRIELDPTSQLFGFSVTPAEMRLLESHADAAQAHAMIDVDRTAAMPVVTGVLPGCSPSEVWLTAHLCHPRPSANDNASGVAALIGVAAAHAKLRQAGARWGTKHTIRFVWGPEFVGVAAMLHQMKDRTGPPTSVINLDMVGEDQALCGGPFVLERNPETQIATIAPVAEHLMDAMFARTNRHPGTWRAAPFLGFSDHAIFADPHIGCPAVQLCHERDRFNHSAADSVDRVSPIEMQRATTLGASLAWLLASPGNLPPAALHGILERWCETELAAAHDAADRYPSADSGEWGQRLISYVENHTQAVQSLASGTASASPDTTATCSALTPRWNGPINLRTLIEDLREPQRATLLELLQADKANHALLRNFAIRVDGRRSDQQIRDETSFAMRRPIGHDTAAILLTSLAESGWVTRQRPEP